MTRTDLLQHLIDDDQLRIKSTSISRKYQCIGFEMREERKALKKNEEQSYLADGIFGYCSSVNHVYK